MKFCSLKMMRQLNDEGVWILGSESQSYYQKWNAKGFSHNDSFQLTEAEQKEYEKYLEDFDENELTYYSGHPVEEEPGDVADACEYQIQAYYVYEVRDFLWQAYGIKIYCEPYEDAIFTNIRFQFEPGSKFSNNIRVFAGINKTLEEAVEVGIQHILDTNIIKKYYSLENGDRRNKSVE